MKNIINSVEKPTPEPTVKELQSRVKQLEKQVKDLHKECVTALAERDRNGSMWRRFEIICNQHGLNHPTNYLK